jgi:putative flippase GtrA
MTFDSLSSNLGRFVDSCFKVIGITTPFQSYAKRSKTLVKFGMVGFTGTIVDFTIYKVLINHFGLSPAESKAFSTEAGILNNFVWNSLWTFKDRKTDTSFWQKLFMYNFFCLGGLLISVGIIQALHMIYGDGAFNFFGIKAAYNNIYFFVTIPIVMIWNFGINHFITWREQ